MVALQSACPRTSESLSIFRIRVHFLAWCEHPGWGRKLKADGVSRLDLYPKELKTRDLKRFLLLDVPGRIIHNSQKGNNAGVHH